MSGKLRHQRQEFPDLLRILERDTGSLAGLIEKDYWIMHVLYGLSRQGLSFDMKGARLFLEDTASSTVFRKILKFKLTRLASQNGRKYKSKEHKESWDSFYNEKLSDCLLIC